MAILEPYGCELCGWDLRDIDDRCTNMAVGEFEGLPICTRCARILRNRAGEFDPRSRTTEQLDRILQDQDE